MRMPSIPPSRRKRSSSRADIGEPRQKTRTPASCRDRSRSAVSRGSCASFATVPQGRPSRAMRRANSSQLSRWPVTSTTPLPSACASRSSASSSGASSTVPASPRAAASMARPRFAKLRRPMMSRSPWVFSGKARARCSQASLRWRGVRYQASVPRAAPSAGGRWRKSGSARSRARTRSSRRTRLRLSAENRSAKKKLFFFCGGVITGPPTRRPAAARGPLLRGAARTARAPPRGRRASARPSARSAGPRGRHRPVRRRAPPCAARAGR